MNFDFALSIGPKILVLLALVLVNGFFVAAELALIKIRDTQLDTLIIKGHRRAKIVRRLIANLDSVISVTQLGITLCTLGLGAFQEEFFHELLTPVFGWLDVTSVQFRHASAFVVGTLINSFLIVVIGELVPKALAIRQTLSTALWISQPLEWFKVLSFPFVWLLNHSAQQLLRWAGIEPASESAQSHSEEELRLLVATSQKHSGATPFGRDIVLNALDLRRRIARQVMRPRQQIVGLSTEASIGECLDVAEKSRYSRFPLCEGGDLDKTLGIVHIKDLYAMRLKARAGRDLLPVARKIIYVPETARLEKLLQLFLDRKLHFAIVVDEYGGTVGMVTLENILEELVGQIQDEFDQEKPLAVRISDGLWELDGTLPLHELSELVVEPLSEEGISTTSGWVTHRLGGFPKPGDTIPVGRCELTVDEMDGPRVARLKLKRLPESK
ncbi:MAG: HlyC/CorC family transporter [Verrucomicrobia bacterium]|nr:HlyC/CorC family transporter [Verrucomicrobiota bacterium]